MRINELKEWFEVALHDFVMAQYDDHEALGKVAQYVLSGQGKRVRALLCLLSARSLGRDVQHFALPGAIALELVHAYSLVHDDLPCLDNDDWRRGRPTSHKLFGEGRALLAGDALLTDAFLVLSGSSNTNLDFLWPSPEQRLWQVAELAGAAGGKGMVLGQAYDVYWTARSGASMAILDEIHRLKTGRLLGASCALGALAAGASTEVATVYREAGVQLGLAFQILDDLLDDRLGTGKSQGKDAASGKLTYLTLLSREDAVKKAKRCTEDAVELLRRHAVDATELVDFSLRLLDREF